MRPDDQAMTAGPQANGTFTVGRVEHLGPVEPRSTDRFEVSIGPSHLVERDRIRHFAELVHDWNAPGGGRFCHEDELDKLWDLTAMEESAYWYALACSVLGVDPKPLTVDPQERSNRDTLRALQQENEQLRRQLDELRSGEKVAC